MSRVCHCVLAPFFGDCIDQLKVFGDRCLLAAEFQKEGKFNSKRLESHQLLCLMEGSVQSAEMTDSDTIQAFLHRSQSFPEKAQDSTWELFSDLNIYAISDLYGIKRRSKVLAALTESQKRPIFGDIRMDGPLCCILLEHLVAQHEEQAQEEWKSLLEQCYTQVACLAVRRYEGLMSASVIFSETLSSQSLSNSYEAHTLRQMHTNAMRLGKADIQCKISRDSVHYATCSV